MPFFLSLSPAPRSVHSHRWFGHKYTGEHMEGAKEVSDLNIYKDCLTVKLGCSDTTHTLFWPFGTFWDMVASGLVLRNFRNFAVICCNINITYIKVLDFLHY